MDVSTSSLANSDWDPGLIDFENITKIDLLGMWLHGWFEGKSYGESVVQGHLDSCVSQMEELEYQSGLAIQMAAVACIAMVIFTYRNKIISMCNIEGKKLLKTYLFTVLSFSVIAVCAPTITIGSTPVISTAAATIPLSSLCFGYVNFM